MLCIGLCSVSYVCDSNVCVFLGWCVSMCSSKMFGRLGVFCVRYVMFVCRLLLYGRCLVIDLVRVLVVFLFMVYSVLMMWKLVMFVVVFNMGDCGLNVVDLIYSG